jgi:hypothetical protein
MLDHDETGSQRNSEKTDTVRERQLGGLHEVRMWREDLACHGVRLPFDERVGVRTGDFPCR